MKRFFTIRPWVRANESLSLKDGDDGWTNAKWFDEAAETMFRPYRNTSKTLSTFEGIRFYDQTIGDLVAVAFRFRGGVYRHLQYHWDSEIDTLPKFELTELTVERICKDRWSEGSWQSEAKEFERRLQRSLKD